MARVTDDVSDILRIGVYQLRYLSRVPVHAAVTATVETAKQEHGLRSAGFVNAVLRRVAKDAAEGRLTSDVPAPRAGTPDAQALAKRYAHPGWLVRRWLERFGSERTEALLRHNNRRPAVHLQAACWPLDRIRDALREAGVPFVEAPGLPGVAVQGVRIHELPGYGEGAFVVPDPAQALALAHVAVPAGARLRLGCVRRTRRKSGPAGRPVSRARLRPPAGAPAAAAAAVVDVVMDNIFAPVNLQAVKAVNRSLLLREYVNVLTRADNSRNTSLTKYRIYRVTGGGRALVGEVLKAAGATSYRYLHRGVAGAATYVYEVVGVGALDREGLAATATAR